MPWICVNDPNCTKHPCSFEGCEKHQQSRKLCPGHYQQWRHGQPLRPLRPRRPKGSATFGYYPNWLWTRYRITVEELEAKVEAQGGKCASCGDPIAVRSGQGGAHVDHNHGCCPGNQSCGKCLRDVLCFRCNRGLGFFLDDPERLRKAIDYLTKWQKEEA